MHAAASSFTCLNSLSVRVENNCRKICIIQIFYLPLYQQKQEIWILRVNSKR